jgi:hypothetical protein
MNVRYGTKRKYDCRGSKKIEVKVIDEWWVRKGKK